MIILIMTREYEYISRLLCIFKAQYIYSNAFELQDCQRLNKVCDL